MEFEYEHPLYTAYLDMADPRVNNWPMMSSITSPLTIIVVYYYTVLVIGSRIMRNYPPISVDNFLRVYNPISAVVNFVFASFTVWNAYLLKYSWSCQAVDYFSGGKENTVASLIWYFHLIKMSELLDTLLLVLRKQDTLHPNTILQVFHHSTMVFGSWILVKFAPGGTSAFFAVMNTMVHSSLYAYLMLKRLGFNCLPAFKIGIIEIQIVQFTFVIVISVSAVVGDCGYPQWIAVGIILYCSILIIWVLPVLLRFMRDSPPRSP